MKRVVLLILAFLASTPADAAVATVKTTVTNAGWTDLGVGPMMLTFRGQGVYAVADTTPSVTDGFTNARRSPIRVSSTSHVWARAAGVSNVDVYSAPFVPPVSGGPASTWSVSDATSNGMPLSNGNLTVTASGAVAYKTVRSATSRTAGKLYVEYKLTTSGDARTFFGFANANIAINDYLGDTASGFGGWTNGATQANGFTPHYNLPSVPPQINDVWGLAIDFGVGAAWIAQNNSWFGGNNPSTGSTPIVNFSPASVGPLFAALTLYFNGGTWTIQSNAATQKYPAPSGFTPWN